MAYRIQLRRDTAANWTQSNPILAEGEVGVDLTNKKIKIGDGTATWTQLSYFDDQESTLNLSQLGQSIIPDTDITYDLGSATNRFRDLYLSGNTIDLGGARIKSDPTTGAISFSGNIAYGTESTGVIGLSQDGTNPVETYVLPTPIGNYPAGVIITDIAQGNIADPAIYSGMFDQNNALTGITVVSSGSGYQEGQTDQLLVRGIPGANSTVALELTGSIYSITGVWTNVSETAYYTDNGVSLIVNYTVTGTEVIINSFSQTGNFDSTAVENIDGFYIEFGAKETLVPVPAGPGNLFDRAGPNVPIIAVAWNINIKALDVINVTGPIVTNGVDLSNIPTDISDLTDIEGLLGQGGGADLGDWSFNSNILSENSTDHAVIQASDFAGAKLILKTRGPTAKEWEFDQDGGLTLPGNGEIVFKDNSEETGRIIPSVSDGGGLTVQAETDLKIKVNDGEGGSSTWSFEPNGGLNFPDGTTQTTAYTGEGNGGSSIANGDTSVSIPEAGGDVVIDLDDNNSVFIFKTDGTLELPEGGTIVEGVVTENPTIELTPSNPEAESQKLVIKGGGPVYTNTENNITVGTGALTVAQGDIAYFFVSAPLYANESFYWWVDNYSPGSQFQPDTGEIVLDEFGNANFDFTVLDSSVPLRVYVSDTLYNAYANSKGAVSLLVNDPENQPAPDLYHLHLTTGDLQETSIFLGTDEHNVRTKIDGSVELTSYDYDNDYTYKLNFKNNVLKISSTNNEGDEDLYIKAEDDLYLDALDDDIHIRAADDIRLRSGYDFGDDIYQYELRFTDSGTLIFDSDNVGEYGYIRDASVEGTNIISFEGYQQVNIVANSDSVNRKTWEFTSGGEIYLPPSDPDNFFSGQIYAGGNGTGFLNLNVQGFAEEEDYGAVRLGNQDNKPVELWAGINNKFRFDSDGSFTLPTDGGAINIPSESINGGRITWSDEGTTKAEFFLPDDGEDGKVFVLGTNTGVPFNLVVNGEENAKGWTFGTDGILNIPTSTFGYANINTGESDLYLGSDGSPIRILANGTIEFPDATVQSTAWNPDTIDWAAIVGPTIQTNGLPVGTRFTQPAPESSVGQAGDTVGAVAFDGDYIYYCTSSYVPNTFTTMIASPGMSINTIPVVKGDYPTPQPGWTVTVLGFEFTIDAVEDGGTSWIITTTSSLSAGQGVTATLSTGVPLPDIWKRTAWSGDTW